MLVHHYGKESGQSWESQDVWYLYGQGPSYPVSSFAAPDSPLKETPGSVAPMVVPWEGSRLETDLGCS